MAAAVAYQRAAKKANTASAALGKKYAQFKTLKLARTYFKAAAKIEGQFLAALKKITPPDDSAADLRSLIAKTAANQALLLEGSAAGSWADVDSVQTALTKAYRASTAAANLIRSDLGLPPVKF